MSRLSLKVCPHAQAPRLLVWKGKVRLRAFFTTALVGVGVKLHAAVTVFPCVNSGLLIDWLIMMGWDYVSELRPPTGLLVIPQVICEHGEPWWWWCLLGITPDSSTRALWQSYQQRHLGVCRRNGRRSENFACHYMKDLKGSLTCRKILWYGTSGFTIWRKVCCGFLSLLKNLSPRPVWTRDPCFQWQAH
jgi:hypothetical protein